MIILRKHFPILLARTEMTRHNIFFPLLARGRNIEKLIFSIFGHYLAQLLFQYLHYRAPLRRAKNVCRDLGAQLFLPREKQEIEDLIEYGKSGIIEGKISHRKASSH